MGEFIMRLDLCSVCKKVKAEYLWFRYGEWTGNIKIRFLCQKCYELIDDLK